MDIYVLKLETDNEILISNDYSFTEDSNVWTSILTVTPEQYNDNTLLSKVVYEYLISNLHLMNIPPKYLTNDEKLDVKIYERSDLVHLSGGDIVDRTIEIEPMMFHSCYSDGYCLDGKFSDVYMAITKPYHEDQFAIISESDLKDPEKIIQSLREQNYIEANCKVIMTNMTDGLVYGDIETEFKDGQMIIPAIIKED